MREEGERERSSRRMLKAGPVGRSNRSGSRLLFLLPVTPDMERSAVSFETAEERGGRANVVFLLLSLAAR